MKVLVTGASGFIGKHLVEVLLAKGLDLVVSSSHNLERDNKWPSKVSCRQFDILKIKAFLDSGNSLMEYFGNPDKLIHLAWRNSSQHQLAEHLEEELPAHAAFLTAFIHEGLTDLTVTGTSFEYGNKSGKLSEEEPADPNTAYGIAKLALLNLLETCKEQKPFVLKWVRLFNIYGTGAQSNTILSQLNRAVQAGELDFNMSGGEQQRDFLPVETAAQYLASIALQNKVEGVINCCSGAPKMLRSFVEEYLDRNNYSIKLNLGFYPYRAYEPMSIWGDNRKLLSII